MADRLGHATIRRPRRKFGNSWLPGRSTQTEVDSNRVFLWVYAPLVSAFTHAAHQREGAGRACSGDPHP
jgi:hypothetical protein